MRRRYSARRSLIHGRGLFALEPLGAGAILGQLRGRRSAWGRVPPIDETTKSHTLLFDLGDGTVLDAAHDGNSLRWLNHSCQPNCEAVQDGTKIWIQTTQAVAVGEELLIDYQLQIGPDEEPLAYHCRCEAPACRGTMADLKQQPHDASEPSPHSRK